MKNFICFLFLFCLVGCVSATVTEDNACISSPLGDIPASPVLGVTSPPVTLSVTKDFSSIFNKVGDVADQVQVTVNQLTIDSTGDLQWINEVNVSIQGSTPDLPEAPLASYTANGSDPGNQINFQMEMDPNTTVTYLKQPVTLTFTIAGQASGHDNDLSNMTCLGLSGHFSKSL